MAKQGKKYVAAAQLVDRNIMYSVTDAIALARKADFTKYNASVDAFISEIEKELLLWVEAVEEFFKQQVNTLKMTL